MRTYTLAGPPAVSVALPYTPAPFVYYRGFAIRETTGAATATIEIYDGTAISAILLDEITLLPNESAREVYDGPKRASTGIYFRVVAGSVAGSVFVD